MFKVILSCVTGRKTIEDINKSVEVACGEVNWFENMEDFEQQKKEGFVKLTDEGFQILADE